MEGIKDFFSEAKESKWLGASSLSFVLGFLFFIIVGLFSGTNSIFMIAVLIVLFICGVVSFIFFFIALWGLFDDIL